jgi:hypothetical protein
LPTYHSIFSDKLRSAIHLLDCNLAHFPHCTA